MTDSGLPDAFTEQADYEKGFASYYQQHIAPLLADLEQDRQKALRKFVIASVAGIAGILVFCMAYYLGYFVKDYIEAKWPTQVHRSPMTQASAKFFCEHRMRDSAEKYHIEPHQYIAQNQEYLQSCIQYYLQHY